MIMKKSEIKIGGVYMAKITNKLTQIRIDAASRYGGWDATNLSTKKKVRIKSPAKLHEAVGDTAKTKAKKAKATTEANVEEERNMAQTVETQGQGKAAASVCPNCGGSEANDDGDCKTCHEPNIVQQVSAAEKPPKKSRTKKEKVEKPKRTSALDAAAMVLADTGQAMNAKEIVETALAKNLWKSPGGKTPHATLYSAMIREIVKRGPQSRFRKNEGGKFVRT
jgi:hypothetical protein